MDSTTFELFNNFSKECKLLSTFTESELRDIHPYIKRRSYTAGTMIVREGSYQESGFYLIFRGWIKVISVSEDGVEQIYSVLTRNDFFGEMSIIDDMPTSAAVVAKTDCEIISLPRNRFLAMLEVYPKFTIELLRIMSSRVRSANKLVCNLAFMSASEKLKLYLLDIVHRRGIVQEDGSIVITDLPSQREIGSAIGHRRETVARELRKMNEKKIISYNRNRVVVFNEESLQI